MSVWACVCELSTRVCMCKFQNTLHSGTKHELTIISVRMPGFGNSNVYVSVCVFGCVDVGRVYNSLYFDKIFDPSGVSVCMSVRLFMCVCVCACLVRRYFFCCCFSSSTLWALFYNSLILSLFASGCRALVKCHCDLLLLRFFSLLSVCVVNVCVSECL